MSAASEADLAHCRSALVIKPSSLGDIVHTLPAVHAIKASFPHLQMRWLSNPEWMPLLNGNPDLVEVVPFPRGEFRGPRSLPALLRWVWRFNRASREVPEVVLDFQGLLRSGLLAMVRGAGTVVGLSDSREGAGMFHRKIVPVDSQMHAVERYLEMARALGARVGAPASFDLPQGDEPSVALPQDYILIHPFSRGKGKSLSTEALQTLCDCLAPRSLVIVGRCGASPVLTGAHITSFLNETTLLQLVWLARHAGACVSVDSGPMHIAAAVQPGRTIGIHTWSDPRKVGPCDKRSWVWKSGRIAHRDGYSEEEACADSPFGVTEARRVADFVLQMWS